jgi:dihydrodipicolinate synthase/N-acetylneuraminate lyase
MPLHGILPVLQIPFDAEGRMIEADLRREIEFCIAAGSHGVVVPALASEFMVLTDEERRRIVEITVEAAAGRIPVIAGVSAPSIPGACAFARHAETAGATALMALPPYIRRPGPDGVVAFYRALGEATPLPIVLQNAPPPFAAGIGLDLMRRILDAAPNVLYIKEERPPAGHHMSTLMAAVGDRLLGVFGGTAGLYLMSELARGATGCMPSAAIPDVLVAIFEDHTRGRGAEARMRYDRILPLLNLEMSVLMAVSKDVLRRRGIFSQVALRDPEFPALDAGDSAEIDAIWPGVASDFTLPAWRDAA